MQINNNVLFGTFTLILIYSANIFGSQAWAQSTNYAYEEPELISLAPTGANSIISSGAVKKSDLANFVQNMVNTHPAINAANAALEAEKARAQGLGRKLYNPEVELDLETAEANTIAVGISQTIDRHGKRKIRASSGKDDVLVAEAALALVRKTLESEILIALAEYQMARDIINLSEKKLRFSNEFLSLAQKKLAAGDISKSDVLTAKLAVSTARADLANSRLELSKSSQKLTELSGQSQNTWPGLTGIPNSSYSQNWQANPDKLPEVTLALAQSRASFSKIRLAEKMRKTDPTIGGRIGAEGSSALFGVRLAIPLQINNDYRYNVDIAKAKSMQADSELNRIRRQTIARINGTRRRLDASKNAWNDWQSSGADQLEQQRTLLKLLWEAGEISAAQYLIQYNQTFEAQSAAAKLRATYWRAWFEYLDASYLIPNWLEAIK